MKDWKKLLICIAVCAMVSSLISMIYMLTENLIIFNTCYNNGEVSKEAKIYYSRFVEEFDDEYKYENQNENEQDSVEDSTLDDWELPNENTNNNNVLMDNEDYLKKPEEEYENKKVSLEAAGEAMFLGIHAYPRRIYAIYIKSVGIGIISGILVYFIFIKQLKLKQLILHVILCLIALIVIVNIQNIVTYGTFFDIEYVLLNDYSKLLYLLYIVLFVICYIANLLNQKRIAKKLNEELNKE